MEALSVLVFMLAAYTPAQASNYPSSYGYQTVRVTHKGPVLFAHVGSGMLSEDVVGYKSSGPLAQGNPEFITAVVTANCRGFYGESITQTKTLQLGREWNGTGYMSAPFSIYGLQPSGCPINQGSYFEFAFSDNRGNWDSWSDGHLNYHYGWSTIYGSGANTVEFQTYESGTQINLKAWNFIVEQMRR